MDHTILIDRFFRESGSRVQIDWNCFQPPYDAAQGWPLRLPEVDWGEIDWLVLMFQDFVTMHDGVCLELQQVEHRYGEHCDRVIVLHWPYGMHRYYRGPINLVHFNVHEYMILWHLRDRISEWQQIWNTSKTRAWQCLNGRRCPHRLWITQHLDSSWTGGTLSLGDIIPLSGYPYSTYRGTSNEDNWMRLLSVYGQHLFNIVTETQYDQRPGIITEKTIFALLAAQIPIVIGYQGIVQDCQDLGFDMFTDVVDTSYDDLPNDQRWRAALDLNRELVHDYQLPDKIQYRLREQARWLLLEWPQSHIGSCLDQLRAITVRG